MLSQSNKATLKIKIASIIKDNKINWTLEGIFEEFI
jgi:hypothetical protein